MKSEVQIYKSDDILDNTYSVSHVKTAHFRQKKKSGCFSVTARILLEMQVSKCLRNQNKCPPQRAQDAKHSRHSVKGIFWKFVLSCFKNTFKVGKNQRVHGTKEMANGGARFTANVEKDIDFTVLWYK